MRSKIEHALLVVAVTLCAQMLIPPRVGAQAGEVMDEEERESDDASDEPRAERNAPSSATSDDSTDESEDVSVDDWATEEVRQPFPYRVGADVGLEVGGHILASFFTVPKLPRLNTGLGFQGRVATRVYGDIVGEANVGIMFNPENGSEGTFKNAFLRVGARYPFDLGAEPVLFFVGAGGALEFLSVTTISVTGTTPTELDKSAVTAALDLQFGLLYQLTESLALEGILQGNYAFANVVYLNKAASWFAVFGGVSYDL